MKPNLKMKVQFRYAPNHFCVSVNGQDGPLLPVPPPPTPMLFFVDNLPMQ